MNTMNKLAARWQLILGYLGILAIMLACVYTGVGAVSTGTTSSDAELIELEDGVGEVQAKNGDRSPVSETTAFDGTAPLQSMDPSKGAGMTWDTNESTDVEEGLQV